MKNRRSFLMSMVAAAVALIVAVGPVIADELFGTITKVDVEGKKVMVQPKGEDKEIEVKVTDKTEWVTAKGANPIDLAKVERNLTKAKEKGAPGIRVVVTHEKGVASQIKPAAKKKAQ